MGGGGGGGGCVHRTRRGPFKAVSCVRCTSCKRELTAVFERPGKPKHSPSMAEPGLGKFLRKVKGVSDQAGPIQGEGKRGMRWIDHDLPHQFARPNSRRGRS